MIFKGRLCQQHLGVLLGAGCVVAGVMSLCLGHCVPSCTVVSDSLRPHGLGSSVHGDSPGKNTGVGCHTLLQGIFPTQGSNQVSCIADGFFTL